MAFYEQRRFSRVDFDLPLGCVLTTADGARHEGKLRDASINGMRIGMADGPGAGAVCTVYIKLDPLKEVELRGVVMWSKKTEIGVEVHGIREGALDHWREVVVAHAENPATLDNELIERAHILPDTY